MSRTVAQTPTTHDEPPQPAERLTIKQAADILNIDTTSLVQLLDEGIIPSTGEGSHRSVHPDDLLAHKEGRSAIRRAALRELTQLSQQAGMEEVDYRTVLADLP